MIDILCKDIVKKLKVNQIIETGTDKGETVAETSRWFSELYPSFGKVTDIIQNGSRSYVWNEPISYPIFSDSIPGPHQIHSVDLDDFSYRKAKEVFKSNCNIHLHHLNSPEFLKTYFCQCNGKAQEHNMLFFLDAHWGNYWPLRDEIKAIRHLKKYLIVIDDFMVPGKSNPSLSHGDFGFDVYRGRILNWGYICDLFLDIPVRVYYPRRPNRDRRGWILITHGYSNSELGFLGSLELFECDPKDSRHTKTIKPSWRAHLDRRNLIKQLIPHSFLRVVFRGYEKMMSGRLSKKLRYLMEIDTLYSYILQRVLHKIRDSLRFPLLYPYENFYQFDEETESILVEIKRRIPDEQRGDNPAFSKNWKDIIAREQAAKQISQYISTAIPDRPCLFDQTLFNSLQDVGFVILENKKMDTAKVDTLVHFLDQRKVYPSHVPHFTLHKPKEKLWVKKRSSFGSYDQLTILKAPYVAEILSDKEVIDLVANYFGCLPTLSNINLFWSFVSQGHKSKGPQRYHRDVDDYKTVTMFINLTDTREDDGAHVYIKKSHTIEKLREIFIKQKNNQIPNDLNPLKRSLCPEDFFSLPLNGYGFDKLYEYFFSDQKVPLFGERGSVIITDNYGIHRGLPPLSQDRLILWVSFALTATHTQSAAVKPQKRVPFLALEDRVENNKINRYVLRNVVDFR